MRPHDAFVRPTVGFFGRCNVEARSYRCRFARWGMPVFAVKLRWTLKIATPLGLPEIVCLIILYSMYVIYIYIHMYI